MSHLNAAIDVAGKRRKKNDFYLPEIFRVLAGDIAFYIQEDDLTFIRKVRVLHEYNQSAPAADICRLLLWKLSWERRRCAALAKRITQFSEAIYPLHRAISISLNLRLYGKVLKRAFKIGLGGNPFDGRHFANTAEKGGAFQCCHHF